YDFTKLSLAESVLSNLVKTGTEVEKVINGNPSEKIIDDIFLDGVKMVGKPIALMNKEDRMTLVRYLKDNGGFSLKKGIQT
ncbi:helix-turn-helix domain-containing protein, partial [Acinetobacter sp. 163]|nr:helix-turn-helix domain-containing protein [Acinetobacter sp. 163]